jgi:hypothetical protein
MKADEARKFFTVRKKKLKAALRKLEKQRSSIEREYQGKERLGRELKALITKYWPDEPDGRPGIWKGQDGYDLVVLVEGVRKQTGCGIKDAIKHLHDIKCPPCDLHPVVQLVVRYQEAKKHWEPAIRRIREIEAEHDALNAKAKERGPPMTFDEVRDLVNPKKPVTGRGN